MKAVLSILALLVAVYAHTTEVEVPENIPGKVSHHTSHTKDGVKIDNHIVLVFKKLSEQNVSMGGKDAMLRGTPTKACSKEVFESGSTNIDDCEKTCAKDNDCVASVFMEKTQRCYITLWHHATNNGKYKKANDAKLMSYFFCKW